ncbi:MAG: polyprenyl synthetase family protein [Candidatus Omnitrophota bacterium]|nr:polyprenyl synthetase family protein [Candidatus Omnitrophota bacterium]
MFLSIKKRFDKELVEFVKDINKDYLLSSISPLLYRSIKEFMLRPGKRARPMLFLLAYLGFAKKTPPGLYRSAVSLELLHDFLLVHDDIIDRSLVRRGKPSMQVMLQRHLSGHKDTKFNGQDLALVVGDVMYALALQAFLSVKEDMSRKEKAMKKLIDSAIYTCSGEFIELLAGIKNIAKFTKSDIYKIYDLKTARYTFAAPLCIGATLAGADNKQLGLLFKFGIYLGRAFQIKDDYLGIFGSPKDTGKSNLTDLRESKKTIFVWYAYNHCNGKDRSAIKTILAKKSPSRRDLLKIRRIILLSGAAGYARREIEQLIKMAGSLMSASKMPLRQRDCLNAYAFGLLTL